MKSERLTDAEIRAHGWQALVERLGLSGALRFTMQTERGTGDYARERHRTLGSLTVDELLERMRPRQTRRSRRRATLGDGTKR